MVVTGQTSAAGAKGELGRSSTPIQKQIKVPPGGEQTPDRYQSINDKGHDYMFTRSGERLQREIQGRRFTTRPVTRSMISTLRPGGTTASAAAAVGNPADNRSPSSRIPKNMFAGFGGRDEFIT